MNLRDWAYREGFLPSLLGSGAPDGIGFTQEEGARKVAAEVALEGIEAKVVYCEQVEGWYVIESPGSQQDRPGCLLRY